MIGEFIPPASGKSVDWALAYATAGMRVFPTGANKKPCVLDWPNVATTDEAQIRAWWRSWLHADSAWAVPADVVVVDLDCKNSSNGIRDFIAQEGAHPDQVMTPQAATPSGGRHLIYGANGSIYRNNVRVNGWGIDLRTKGGNIPLPGPRQRARLDQAAHHTACVRARLDPQSG